VTKLKVWLYHKLVKTASTGWATCANDARTKPEKYRLHFPIKTIETTKGSCALRCAPAPSSAPPRPGHDVSQALLHSSPSRTP